VLTLIGDEEVCIISDDEEENDWERIIGISFKLKGMAD
jgi:hypothetical protein